MIIQIGYWCITFFAIKTANLANKGIYDEKKFVRLTPWKCFAPCEALGECARKDAIEGCLEGTLLLTREPRLSWPCRSLLSLNRDTFINLAFGVLKIVRFSFQRALTNVIYFIIKKKLVESLPNCRVRRSCLESAKTVMRQESLLYELLKLVFISTYFFELKS